VIDGLVVVDKPPGMTSHDVVGRCRRIFGQRRVGHAGTLDPDATGVLLVGLGRATRLLQFLTGLPKAYECEVVLGVATTTLDDSGDETGRWTMDAVTPAAARAAAATLTGEIDQVPPMVSAIKIDGQRLHELARRGLEVERAPREIVVTTFTLAPTDDDTVWRFDVVCSVGTYVRVLLSDLAVSLGTVGHLVELRRLASGSHLVEDAVTLDVLAEKISEGDDVLSPPSSFVTALEHVTLDGDQTRAMRMGQRVSLGEGLRGEEIAAMDADGNLVGILRRRNESWKPELVLASHGESARG
jgi:tRNA pseudouridine55 synthase